MEKSQDQMTIKLTLIDTPGYGSSKNNREWYRQIKNYIKSKVIIIIARNINSDLQIIFFFSKFFL